MVATSAQFFTVHACHYAPVAYIYAAAQVVGIFCVNINKNLYARLYIYYDKSPLAHIAFRIIFK